MQYAASSSSSLSESSLSEPSEVSLSEASEDAPLRASAPARRAFPAGGSGYTSFGVPLRPTPSGGTTPSACGRVKTSHKRQLQCRARLATFSCDAVRGSRVSAHLWFHARAGGALRLQAHVIRQALAGSPRICSVRLRFLLRRRRKAGVVALLEARRFRRPRGAPRLTLGASRHLGRVVQMAQVLVLAVDPRHPAAAAHGALLTALASRRLGRVVQMTQVLVLAVDPRHPAAATHGAQLTALAALAPQTLASALQQRVGHALLRDASALDSASA